MTGRTGTGLRKDGRGRAVSAMLAGIALMTLATGCTRIRDAKGYIADNELIGAIQPGIDNRASVMKTLGRPTLEGEFDKNNWFYVSRKTKQFAFFWPKTTEHQVVVVQFDPKGNVAGVQKLGMDQIVSVDPSNDKTPTYGKDVSLLQQIFGNIGKFSPAAGGGGGGMGGPE